MNNTQTQTTKSNTKPLTADELRVQLEAHNNQLAEVLAANAAEIGGKLGNFEQRLKAAENRLTITDSKAEALASAAAQGLAEIEALKAQLSAPVESKAWYADPKVIAGGILLTCAIGGTAYYMTREEEA